MIKKFLVILPFIHEVIFSKKNKVNKESSTFVKLLKLVFYALILFSLILNYFTIQRLYKISSIVVKLKEQHTADLAKASKLEAKQDSLEHLSIQLSELLLIIKSQQKNNTDTIARLIKKTQYPHQQCEK